MKKITLLFVLAFVVSCQQQSKDEADLKADSIKNAVSNAHNAKNSLDYIGIYKGILPCADCQGLDTEIAINENGTFCIKTKYEGKGDKIFELKGNFIWNKAGNIIVLTDVKNAPNQYLVGENKLTQLDISGKKITGDLASEYILAKQPTDTATIETAEEKKHATVNLNNKMEATTVIKKVNPAVGKYTLAETKWKLVVLNQKVVTQNGNKPYFIKLNSKDGRFTAYAGCNSMMGNYVMPSAYTLSFSEVAATKMACPNMTLETQFFALLEKTNSYLLDNETLTFFGKRKAPLARFEAIK
ncbi:copper resistance protein NlpE N-terminal domain-containing protein [Flavobacterium sp. AS60]|uniref:copper resistance protein NlpE N-terminal domain-containing protein n=1 Tax=Flavobacterium anseongense TaxID=2910677 RepID=UPI001F351715|nr:copper resistance protein NlpE N-terminal domain-containing protein [Flavobacterium sp. AS60]MCF6130040.1 copper resistance protein NlpE N-terminal domain-containing protein [Flavobacterium sp. AS60]